MSRIEYKWEKSCSLSLAFNSAHVKCSVWLRPKECIWRWTNWDDSAKQHSTDFTQFSMLYIHTANVYLKLAELRSPFLRWCYNFNKLAKLCLPLSLVSFFFWFHTDVIQPSFIKNYLLPLYENQYPMEIHFIISKRQNKTIKNWSVARIRDNKKIKTFAG